MTQPTYHLIDAKHRDEILNTRRTVCGLQGHEGRSTDEIIIAGVVHRLTHRPAGVTCDQCLPALRRLTAPALLMLKSAATPHGMENEGKFDRVRLQLTYRALHRRGLVERGKITPRGRKVLEKELSK